MAQVHKRFSDLQEYQKLEEQYLGLEHTKSNEIEHKNKILELVSSAWLAKEYSN